MTKTIIKNAVANVSRGGASAVVALALPPILVRHMSATDYAVWVLVLQLSVYVSYLDVGLQAAIGRYIAFARERNDIDSRDGIFSTAFAGLSLASAAGLVLLAALSVLAPHFFTSVPAALVPAMRVALLIVGSSIALGLPASAWNAVFIGLQRYDIPAITMGGCKLLSAAGLAAAAFTGKSLVTMAVIVASTNLLSYGAQYVMLRKTIPDLRFRRHHVTWKMARELWSYCYSLTVWSFSMLLVTGFDLILVGRFDFKSVAPYAVSATLITFLAGLQNSVFGVIMPHAATMQAREDAVGLGRLLISTTRLGTLILLIVGMPLIYFAAPLLQVWIGAAYVKPGTEILQVLVIANLIRLIGVPYSSILIGTGQQRLIIIGPLAEGISNLTASVLLGWRFGAIGVAVGTLIGSVVGMAAQIFYNIPNTSRWIVSAPLAFLRQALALPILCAAPLALRFLFQGGFGNPWDSLGIVALVLSTVACVSLLAYFARGLKELGTTGP